MQTMNEFKVRRNKLYRKLKKDSLLILYAGPLVKKSADSFYPFSVNKNFYYLTGIEQHDSLFIALKKGDEVSEHLLLLPLDPLKAKWDGPRLVKEVAIELSAINNIADLNESEALFAKLKEESKHVYFDLEPGLLSSSFELIKDYAAKQFKDYEIIDVYEEIIKLRMVKSRAEVKLIQESIKLTRKALLSAQKLVKSGKYEYEVAAKFLYEVTREKGILGFDTIVASGNNATILHYPTLNSQINENDLVLLDLGGHNNMYTADISRTYPADKKFTKTGLTIYKIVLACNKAVIDLIKPGLTLLDLQNFTKNFLKRELVKANLLKEKDDIAEVYYHGVSHHLGLDTHDPSLRALPLKAGNVITVEPGLYFAKYGIGVRIEDNVLVTAKGSKNLSRNIPKEVEDIIK